MMRSPSPPRSVIAPISVEKRVTKFNSSVDDAVDGEAISVGRTLIERRTGRASDKEPVDSRRARDVQTCTAREYTPAYRMELVEFCFPTMATKACQSKI